jgi:hypothetical protein
MRKQNPLQPLCILQRQRNHQKQSGSYHSLCLLYQKSHEVIKIWHNQSCYVISLITNKKNLLHVAACGKKILKLCRCNILTNSCANYSLLSIYYFIISIVILNYKIPCLKPPSSVKDSFVTSGLFRYWLNTPASEISSSPSSAILDCPPFAFIPTYPGLHAVTGFNMQALKLSVEP